MDKIVKEYMKRDGFHHERLLVLPKQILDNSQINSSLGHLYLTDIGYFPRAKHHYRERVEGCDNHIFMMCVEGRGIVEVDGDLYTIMQNQYIIIPKETAHRYYANNENPWSIYWFHFSGSSANSYIDMVMDNQVVGTMTSMGLAWFVKQFGVIYNLLESGYSKNHMMAVSNLLGLLMTGLKVPLMWDDSSYSKKSPVDECIAYMLEHMSERLTLEQLAERMHMSRSHIIELFKEHTGYTPIDYFIHLKVQKSCRMLDQTDMSINEIALQIGYEDPFYYSRIFKKVMGMSPRDYRKTEKG